MAIAATAQTGGDLIRWGNLWWVALAFAVMIGAIVSHDVWFLNFVHVLGGLLWTGIDLFMGFVLGPILRSVDLPVRRAIVIRLMPRMFFIMPVLSISTGTTGWFLAEQLGFLAVGWPQQAWIIAALAITTILSIQGLGFLLPTNLRLCLELAKAEPDFPRIGVWMRRYVRVVAIQGTLQVAIVVVMARIATGL